MRCYYIQMSEVAPNARLAEAIQHDFLVFAFNKDQAKCVVSDTMRNSNNIPCGFTYSMRLTGLHDISLFLNNRNVRVLRAN